MCQFNLYLTPTETEETIVKSALGRFACAAGHKIAGHEDYTTYVIGWCNCDSFIHKAASYYHFRMAKSAEDTPSYASLAEYYADGLRYYQSLYEKLSALRKEPDHAKKQRAYNKERMRLTNALLAHTAHVGDYERKELARIHALALSEEKEQRATDAMYAKMDGMYKEAENTAAYLTAQQTLQTYIANNADYEESQFLTLRDIKGNIKELEQYDFEPENKEFRSFKRKVSKLLKQTDRVGLYPMWATEEETLHPKKEMTVRLKELTVDMLAVLPYDHLLWITR